MGIVEEAGERLFEEFGRVFPLQGKSSKGGHGGKQANADVVAAGLAKFFSAANVERAKYRLGLVKRARVALYLQQRLLAAGYAPPLVRQVLFSMLVAAFVG